MRLSNLYRTTGVTEIARVGMGRVGSGTRACDSCVTKLASLGSDTTFTVCALRLTCVRYSRYVLMCLVSLFICLRRPVLRHLRRNSIVSMSARRASWVIVCRCAMCGIEFKVYTSFVHERSCLCVACTCEIDKGPFIYRRYARVYGRVIMHGRLICKVLVNGVHEMSGLPSPVALRVIPLWSEV